MRLILAEAPKTHTETGNRGWIVDSFQLCFPISLFLAPHTYMTWGRKLKLCLRAPWRRLRPNHDPLKAAYAHVRLGTNRELAESLNVF